METEECPICRESITLPFTLECKHTFCYLCIKRASQENRRCPLCRRRITYDLEIQGRITPQDEPRVQHYTWVYAGANVGFWQFDPRSDEEIERAYQKFVRKEPNSESLDIYIMNRLYTIDFEREQQIHRRGATIVRRKIQRIEYDGEGKPINPTINIKGIAGLSWTNDLEESLRFIPRTLPDPNMSDDE